MQGPFSGENSYGGSCRSGGCSRILSISFPGVSDALIKHNYLLLIASWNKDELQSYGGPYETERWSNETSCSVDKCSVMPMRPPLWREGVNFICIIASELTVGNKALGM